MNDSQDRLFVMRLFITLLLLMIHTTRSEEDRIATARLRCENILRDRFQKAEVNYPSKELFLRAFKREAIVEMWARNQTREPFKLIASYPVTCNSGTFGPKRREGDRQVPEGFYHIDRYNPKSNFHLSLGINYPNDSDKILSDKEQPGSDIFIHGSNLSIGCLPLGNEGIEEVYLAALDCSIRPVPVHIFPAKMNTEDWLAWRNEQTKSRPELAVFWEQLLPVYAHFEKKRQLPKITVRPGGAYKIEK
jgi:murein L,D-transpeptidase YafK